MEHYIMWVISWQLGKLVIYVSLRRLNFTFAKILTLYWHPWCLIKFKIGKHIRISLPSYYICVISCPSLWVTRIQLWMQTSWSFEKHVFTKPICGFKVVSCLLVFICISPYPTVTFIGDHVYLSPTNYHEPHYK